MKIDSILRRQQVGKILLMLSTALLLLTGTTSAVLAQRNPNAGETNRNVPQKPTVPLATVLTAVTRATGIDVVADRSVAGEQVTELSRKPTAETIDDTSAEVVRSLPQGTVWAKLYLPTPKGRRGFDGNAVADYALAQAKLFGNVGGSTPAGTIEVMGQKVSGEQANAVAATLNLKPVYVILHPNRRDSGGGFGDWTKWAGMTAEEKMQYAQQQAQQLINMDPNARMMYFEQMRATMGAVMQSLTPEQRGEFMRGMREMGRPGGGPPFRP